MASVRDAVESIGVAIVLAFVLRAFMVEAFVIPTGSMAPRLMGEHVLVRCQSCKFEFAYGRSKEAGVPRCGTCKYPLIRCPSCNYRTAYSVGVETSGKTCETCGRLRNALSRPLSGDRVLVLKYLYRFAEPQPFDVVVFKNPQDNTQNYIKRLIGLPGETIEIVHGDIFVRAPTAAPWRIRRKPPRAQKAMWQVVFDNDYRPDEALHNNFPVWQRRGGGEAWDAVRDEDRNAFCLKTRTFRFNGAGPQEQEIEFRTVVDDYMPNYGYNVPLGPVVGFSDSEEGSAAAQASICTDLKLSFTFEPQRKASVVAPMLSSFKHRFRGEVRGDGDVRLLHKLEGERDWSEWGAARAKGLAVGKACEVALTHADFRVTLWVDGEAVLVSKDEQYTGDHRKFKARMLQVAGTDNRRPVPIPVPRVRIGASGGPCILKHVLVMRDVFYTRMEVQAGGADYISPLGDYHRARREAGLDTGKKGWAVIGRPIELVRNDDNPDLDEFFVLGDNSPQSLDSRAWVTASPSLRLYADQDKKVFQYKLGTVPRYNMIGKAFFVYWPAGFALPGLPELPIVPNVGRMRLIR